MHMFHISKIQAPFLRKQLHHCHFSQKGCTKGGGYLFISFSFNIRSNSKKRFCGEFYTVRISPYLVAFHPVQSPTNTFHGQVQKKHNIGSSSIYHQLWWEPGLPPSCASTHYAVRGVATCHKRNEGQGRESALGSKVGSLSASEGCLCEGGLL